MKALFFLILILLPATARAQLDYHDCLHEGRVDNRVSGKVVYLEYKHPFNEILIKGYKILLLRPRCFAYEPRVDPKATNRITEVQILTFGESDSYKMQNRFFKSDRAWKELDDYLRPLIGKHVVLTGQLEERLTIYFIARYQIVVRSIGRCEISPTSIGIERC